MKVLNFGHTYSLDNFSKKENQTISIYQYGTHENLSGLNLQDLTSILIERTSFLNNQKPCIESGDSLYYLEESLASLNTIFGKSITPLPKIIDEGHSYELTSTDGKITIINFIKRNAGKFIYSDQHDGIQSQELIRTIICHLEFILIDITTQEIEDLINNFRMVLFLYEARAYRRKIEKVNREEGSHQENQTSDTYRVLTYHDVPFSSNHIEILKTGSDGHIIKQ